MGITEHRGCVIPSVAHMYKIVQVLENYVQVSTDSYKNFALQRHYHFIVRKTELHCTSVGPICVSSSASSTSKLYGALSTENSISEY